MLNIQYKPSADASSPPWIVERLSTSIGTLAVLSSARGLLAIDFDGHAETIVERAQRRLGVQAQVIKGKTKEAAQLVEYFAGTREHFDLDIDLSGLPQFQQAVLTALCQVTTGCTVTYASLARAIGKPKAARAVGNALGRNPIPVVVPCHRVLQGTGALGGFTGGLHRKIALLKLEHPDPTKLPLRTQLALRGAVDGN
ncbi:MAG: methylated-DNA--[protein]-cysteine S-methyltransferase [Myxococcales bacterium]|nr:methylated-DNA--[protein]-cysteine S-methyltransferase [Myxococcales bacterium]